MDLDAAGVKRKMQLWELDEWREKAYHNSKIYKERVKTWHDKRIKKKEFAPREKVLLFNSRVKLFRHRKLWSKWDGPFMVVSWSSHGAITLQNDEGTLFKVNGQCLKLFLEPNKELEELDIINFFFT
jgi:WD40 repeat protein